jgi:hypothetical protein
MSQELVCKKNSGGINDQDVDNALNGTNFAVDLLSKLERLETRPPPSGLLQVPCVPKGH